MQYQIHKAAAIITQDHKLLVTRSRGKEFFVAPGGKVEKDETIFQALKRELKEELNIEIREEDVTEFGIYYANAAGNEDKVVRMDTFIVHQWAGEISINNEIEEYQWIDTAYPQGMKIGSIFEHEVIPKLKKLEMIN